jgi:hypothetical protein
MAKPKDTAEAAAFLLDAVRKGCLGDGDAAAVRMLLAERRALLKDRLRLAEDFDRLALAADDCLSLLECCELEGTEGEDGRIEALRQALNA